MSRRWAFRPSRWRKACSSCWCRNSRHSAVRSTLSRMPGLGGAGLEILRRVDRAGKRNLGDGEGDRTAMTRLLVMEARLIGIEAGACGISAAKLAVIRRDGMVVADFAIAALHRLDDGVAVDGEFQRQHQVVIVEGRLRCARR